MARAADDVDPLRLEADLVHRLDVLASEPVGQVELLAEAAEHDALRLRDRARDRDDVDRLAGAQSEGVLRVLQAAQFVDHPHDREGSEVVLTPPDSAREDGFRVAALVQRARVEQLAHILAEERVEVFPRLADVVLAVEPLSDRKRRLLPFQFSCPVRRLADTGRLVLAQDLLQPLALMLLEDLD